MFKDYPALRVEISGHTSNEGKREFNMKLSRKRAVSVKEFLVSAGIDESRIGTVGYGPDKPIADNDTKEGQEKNRRIEFRLLSAKESISNQPEAEDINPSPDRKHPKKEKPAKGDSSEKAGQGEEGEGRQGRQAGRRRGQTRQEEEEGIGARRRADAEVASASLLRPARPFFQLQRPERCPYPRVRRAPSCGLAFRASRSGRPRADRGGYGARSTEVSTGCV